MFAVEIEDLCKTYRGKRFSRVDALKNLNLKVPTGEVFGFLGPNGAGKSTTIKLLMGLITPTSGVVRLSGHVCRNYRSRLKVGYLPENPSFYDYLTADEYLTFVGRIFKMDTVELDKEKRRVLERLGLWSDRCRPLRGFSKGMVQRLGLAQTLIHSPDIYVLDEPMSGLDPVGRALVKEIILELRTQGKTVFFSTHITADVEILCDQIGIVVKGTLREACRIDELLQEGASEYLVRYRAHESKKSILKKIQREQLALWIEQSHVDGHEIISINSKRQTLEDFFLETVHKEQVDA